ncbi:sensor histidine kinase [Flavitalea flava]
MEKIQNQPDTTLFENLPVAIYTCDSDGFITYYNKAAASLWGREPEKGKDQWCGSWRIFSPDGDPLPLDSCPMGLALKGKKIIHGDEIVIQRPDGTKRVILPYPDPILDSDGELTGAINTLIDITELKKGETRQAMLAAIIESSEDAIISKTLQGIITSWNDAAEKLWGYTEKEALGKHISLLIPPDRISEEAVIIEKIRKGERIDHYETIRLTKAGEEIPISLTVSPIKDKTGRIIGASKIARNIKDKKAAEEALKQHSKNLEILNTLGQLVSKDLDVQTILQKVTDESTKLTGAAFGAFFFNTMDEKGESIMSFTFTGAPKEAFENFGMQGNIPFFNTTTNGVSALRSDDITKEPGYGKNAPHPGTPEGHLPVVSYLAVPVTSPSGKVTGGLFFGHPKPGIFNEEHEKLLVGIAVQASIALDNAKLYEEIKILNAKKDEFIGIASHELKTPLTSMKGYLQLLERNLSEDVDLSFVKKTLRQVNNLSGLVSDLLDVSKIQSGKLQLSMELFDFHGLLTETIGNIQESVSSHQIILHAEEQPFFIRADRQRLEQVLNNLIVNAIKYSPGSNLVNIELLPSGQEISVSVKDYGIGISKESQKNIFAKFFRAEDLDSHMSGLGLGLYITKEIIDRHKGKIWVDSEPGKGSVFYFCVPV